MFRFILGVEVIEIAEKLVEAMHGWQIVVTVAEVILTELSGDIAEWLEQLSDCGVLIR